MAAKPHSLWVCLYCSFLNDTDQGLCVGVIRQEVSVIIPHQLSLACKLAMLVWVHDPVAGDLIHCAQVGGCSQMAGGCF